MLSVKITCTARRIKKLKFQKNAGWTGPPLWPVHAAVDRFLSLWPDPSRVFLEKWEKIRNFSKNKLNNYFRFLTFLRGVDRSVPHWFICQKLSAFTHTETGMKIMNVRKDVSALWEVSVIFKKKPNLKNANIRSYQNISSNMTTRPSASVVNVESLDPGGRA